MRSAMIGNMSGKIRWGKEVLRQGRSITIHVPAGMTGLYIESPAVAA